MSYTVAAILSLASHCAPGVAPQTVAALVQTESHGNPFALGVNGPQQPSPKMNAAEAAAVARHYIALGYSVDLGLGQINSRNMRKLGLTWATVFDPCTNIAALGHVLSQNYFAVADGREPQDALRLAISLYNTGSTSRGFRNGYVARVVGNAGVAEGVTPANLDAAPTSAIESDMRQSIITENNAQSSRAESSPPPPPPAWNVFERAAYDREAIPRSPTEQGTNLWAN